MRRATVDRQIDPVERTAKTERQSMQNLKKSALIVLALALNTSAASAVEAAWPGNSASDLAVFLTLQRFRNHADHCSATLPQLKPRFDSLMEDLDRQTQVMSAALLASDAYKDMKDKPVPAEIIFALKDSFHDAQHNFERQDAAFVCPKSLQNLGAMDDESLKSGLTESFAAVQNMIRNLEKGAR